MNYQRAAILGIGQLAFECAKITYEMGIDTEIFDTNVQSSSVLDRIAQGEGIPYHHLDKAALFNHFEHTSERTLIVSAHNPLLIPARVLGNPNIKAINCHHALLPKHPGRNAEAWAIFEQDPEAGITWHQITPEVDAGRIIDQKRVCLDETMTSFQLLKIQHQLASQSFQEIISGVLNNKITGVLQDSSQRGKLHYSWEVPNNGFLDTSWSGEKMSAFLRAMDYGILNTLGKPRLLWGGKRYFWKKYLIEKNAQNSYDTVSLFSEANIQIQKDGYQITLLNYKLDEKEN